MKTIPYKPDENLIVTVQQHILQEQRKHSPTASGDFSWLLSGITLATKMTQAKVRRAGLLDVLGDAGDTNSHGERQQKLDVFANEALLHYLGIRESVAMLVSEEGEEAVTFQNHGDRRKYVVVFDPLDGSSNIDVNISVGTIFSVMSNRAEVDDDPRSSVLQPGRKQLAAGYVVYGSSTILVYTTGHGVHGFTLDPDIGAYVLSHENIRMPEQGNIYSVNEANFDTFPAVYQEYITRMRKPEGGRRYTSRYIGSLVADFHRTLLKGGVFLYPPTAQYPEGKLRLLYEANPIAFIAQQAGGAASAGTRPVLDVLPTEVHQRTPLVVGSRYEMDRFAQLMRRFSAAPPPAPIQQHDTAGDSPYPVGD